jgi:hypothetical protein
MNVRKTFRNLRKQIQQDFQYELPWYVHMEFQKEFREKLKEFQKQVCTSFEFIDRAQSFNKELDFSLIKDNSQREALEEFFEDIFSQSEPWNLINFDIHPEDAFLEKLHAKLKKTLSAPVQLCLF